MLVALTLLIACGLWLQGCGSGGLDATLPDGLETSLARAQRFLQGNVYEEGIITNADYPKEWYDSEVDAQAACNSDVDCKGYWQRSSGEYFILKAGSRTFSNGVPHFTVLVVKVKNLTVPAPTPAPAPTPVPTLPTPAPTPAPSPIPPTYEEGIITNAEYPKQWYDSEEMVQAACTSDVDCKGYWQRSGGVYFILKAGSRTFSNGVPHFTVLLVKVKNPIAPAPTPAPEPTTAPVPVPTSPPSSTSTAPPAPAPGSPEYQKLNFRTVGCPAEFEITSQEECRRAITSLGVTVGSNVWIGTNTDMPRLCSLQKATDTMIWNDAATGALRHDLAPVCKWTGTPTPPEPTPAPVPDSRDTKTVAPEEWDYFLAFQEIRKNGFSCACFDGLAECNEIEAEGKNYHPPNPEKATFDCTLWIAAYRHAEDQAIQNYCSHTARDGRSARQRAEAVGAKGGAEHQGCQGSPSEGPASLAGLLNSPPHCNSMFQRSFRGFAVGHGDGPNGDSENVWTMMYNSGSEDISDSESCIPEGYTATGDLK